MRRRTFVVAGIAALTAGCSRAKSDAGPPIKATLLTSYGTRGRDAYAYVAVDKGYFRAAGFDVRIEPGGDLAAGLRRLASAGGSPVFATLDLTGCLLAAVGPDAAGAPVAPGGADQGGPGPGAGGPGAGPGTPPPNQGGPGAGQGGPGGEQTAQARQEGPGGLGAARRGPRTPPPGRGGPGVGFRFLAGIHQRTTAAILAPGGGRIGTARDLGGKTLADLPGSIVRGLFPAYARLAGIDPAGTKWVAATPQTMAGQFAGGRIAGVGDTIVGRQAVEAATHGRTAVVLAYTDQLQDLYGDALVTSTAYAQAQPGKAREFTAALLQGLADAINDPAAAGLVMHKHVPSVTVEAAADELTQLAPYIRSNAEGLPVGALDANRVARGIALLQGAGQIPPGLTPDQLMI